MSTVDSTWGFSIDKMFNVETWRILAGSRRCAFCDTPIGLFTICEEDDDGMPISERPTGVYQWSEMVGPPGFGREHTPARCVEAREAA